MLTIEKMDRDSSVFSGGTWEITATHDFIVVDDMAPQEFEGDWIGAEGFLAMMEHVRGVRFGTAVVGKKLLVYMVPAETGDSVLVRGGTKLGVVSSVGDRKWWKL